MCARQRQERRSATQMPAPCPPARRFNASRGLGLTWWKEALKLFALTCGSFCVVRLVLYLLVLTQCGKDAHNKDAHSKDLGGE